MRIPVFTDEQRRVLLNLRQYYSAWSDAERQMRQLSPHPLHWKTVKGRDYLYAVFDSQGNAKSLGPRSIENDALYSGWRDAKRNRDQAKMALIEIGRIYKSLRLGTISADAAAILREADLRKQLGVSLLVVGTNAMPAYEIEAQSRIAMGLDETMDFDMAWIGGLNLAVTSPSSVANDSVWEMLKAVDSSYTVNTERTFQARNSKAYEVELVIAPSQLPSMITGDHPVPVVMDEQEWLLQGKFVDHVVIARDGSPARIVAPDPRWFALHKLWMSEQSKRNPLKRPKDRKQGERLMTAIYERMPHYEMGQDFTSVLPVELFDQLSAWKDNQGIDLPSPQPSW